MVKERIGNLKEYFADPSTRDSESVNNAFYLLYQEMENIHKRNSFVNSVSATDAFVGEDKAFYRDVYRSTNPEVDSEKNLLDLTKMFLGTYMSLGVEFSDLSKTPLDVFVDNYDSIERSIVAEDFPSDYFRAVFVNGEIVYYNNYSNRNLASSNSVDKSQSKVQSKTLYLGAPGRFSSDENSEKQLEEKTPGMAAYINFVFYPVMIFCLTVIAYVIYKILVIF